MGRTWQPRASLGMARPVAPASVALLVVATTWVVATAQDPGAGADAPRPDIVVVYVDDSPQAATHLWSDPERTPALARFVDDGTWLAAATGSTPTCCPARVNTLTGTWSHRNGVTENDMAAFDPTDTVAVRLQAAGYRTLYGGKFLNRFPRYVRPPSSVEHYAQGWDEFDVMITNHGKFYDYPLWTRDGRRRYRDSATDHSTFVVTTRMAQHIRQTPAGTPIFAFLSLFDGHAPYEPMPRFRGHPACADVRPWDAPSYNEADVSDKPAYVRDRAPLEAGAYDLTARCEGTMTVDWAVSEVVAALADGGRLEDTLLVYTADNGYLMGDHRIEDKLAPYATPVPLYVRWPGRWPGARTITEPVSNVDLAPTFCAIAGCDMAGADGLDLLPLLDGTAEMLDRRFIYEEYLHSKRGLPAWYGLRTTEAFAADERWVYTEYASGEVELYDLVADPWQLENLAGSEAQADLRERLHDMLHDEVIAPRGVAFRTSSIADEESPGAD